MDQAEGLRNIIRQREQTAFPQKKKARVITVTSGKGGVGKSNTTVNLAIQLSKLGKRVVIFDADIGLANVEVMFGVVPTYNLSDVIYRGMMIQDVVTEGPCNVGFISGGSGIIGLSNITRDQVIFLVRNIGELESMYDYVLIDTGAGISDQVMEFVLSSPEIILVSTPEPSSLTDSYSLLKMLHMNPAFDASAATINVIANRVNSTEDGNWVYNNLNSVVSKYLNGQLRYLGLVPADNAIDKAIRAQKAVSLYSPDAESSKAYAVIASNLANDELKYYNINRGFSGLIRRVFGA